MPVRLLALLLGLLFLAQAAELRAQPATAASLRAHALYGPPMPSPDADAPQADRWLSFDKVQHVTVSLTWTLGSQYVLVSKLDLSEGAALPLAVVSAAAAGLGKELLDLHLEE